MSQETGSRTGERVAIVGAGSWGTALALVAARSNHDVSLWAREAEVADSINQDHRNPFYLSDFNLPENIRATCSLREAVQSARFALIVIPSHTMREMMERMQSHLHSDVVIVSAAKGVENGTLMRMSEVISDVLHQEVASRFVALSGPSFAREVAKGDPTAIVAASGNAEASGLIQLALSSSTFRVYTNNDLVKLELGGAVRTLLRLRPASSEGLVLGLARLLQ
jgi:glycerol-3-phosphate dehydrogenase (NAD(P)+)